MFAAHYELALIASPTVQSLAGTMFEEIRDDYARARVGRPAEPQNLSLHEELLTALREDLQDRAPINRQGL